MSNNFKNILLFISLCVNAFILSYNIYKEDDIKKEIITIRKTKTETIVEPYCMSEWEMFTMALMDVESKYDSTAVSSVGAKGYLQITPIYIKEVNKKHNTNYTMKDVTNLEKSYEIFDLMQQAHNPDYDMKKALRLHNGEHDWYNRRVMQSYRDIKKYENVRNRLVKVWQNTEQNL